MNWRLYIDESGDQGAPDREFAVVGLLVPAPSRAFESVRLRVALIGACPWAQWPMHGRLLRRGAMQALWAMGPLRDRVGDPALIEAVERTRSLWRRACGSALKAACDAIEDHEEPRDAELDLLERVLRRDLALWVVWDTLAFRAAATARRVLERAAIEAREAGAPAYLLVAAESVRGSAGPLGTRYPVLLGALIERLRDLLLALGGSHHVYLSAQVVFVTDDLVPLRRRAVVSEIKRVLGAVTVWRGDDTVTVEAEETVSFGPFAPGAHVLVDHAAGWVHHELKRRPIDSRRMTQLWEAETGLITRVGDLPLLTLYEAES